MRLQRLKFNLFHFLGCRDPKLQLCVVAIEPSLIVSGVEINLRDPTPALNRDFEEPSY